MAPVSSWVGIPLGLWRMDSMTPNLPLPTQAVTEHHRPLPGTKFYCLVTEVHVYEQLARGHYVKQSGRDSNLWSMDILFQISLSVLLATCHQCVLILLETSAVYKSFTYLLTYLLTYCWLQCPNHYATTHTSAVTVVLIKNAMTRIVLINWMSLQTVNGMYCCWQLLLQLRPVVPWIRPTSLSSASRLLDDSCWAVVDNWLWH